MHFDRYSLSDPEKNEMLNTLLITDDFVTYFINYKLTKQSFCLKQHSGFRNGEDGIILV